MHQSDRALPATLHSGDIDLKNRIETRGYVVALALCYCLTGLLGAATISGIVSDSVGGRLQDADLSLLNAETGRSRTTKSNRYGRYRFDSVPPGSYELASSHPGFRTVIRRGLTLAVGQHLDIDLLMTVGPLAEEVVVTSRRPNADVNSVEVSNLIDGRRVQEMPLNGRDWANLAELSPAVVRARSTGYFSAANMQAGRISVAGQRPNAANFVIDGTDMNVYSGARPPGSVAQGLVLGVEAIKEFRLVTSNYGSDYGIKSGGLVEVVSKSGTNRSHGSLYWFHRNGALDARDYFDPGSESDFVRNQFGISAGGPIIKNRTFYFVNYEGLRERKEEVSSGVVPNLLAREGLLLPPGGGEPERIPVHPEIAPYLALYPVPNGSDFGNGTALWSGRGIRNLGDNFVTLRIDDQITQKDSLFGRYTVDFSEAQLPFASSEFPGWGRKLDGRDHLLTLRHNHYFSSSFLNDLTFGFNRSGRTSSLEEPDPGGLSFSIIPGAPFGSLRVGGLGLVGYSPRPVSDLYQNVYQISDAVSLVKGRHSLKFGLEFKRFHVNNNQEIDTNGVVSFPSLRSLLLNNPTLYRGAAPGADFVRRYRFSQFGFYLQDHIAIGSSFNVTLGLRYEPWSNVSEADGKLSILLDPLGATGPEDYQAVDHLFVTNPSLRNWAPRIGFAWDLLGNGDIALRGGFGVFHDSPLNGSLLGPVTAAPPWVRLLTVRNPGFPNILGSSTGPVTPNLSPWVLEYDGFSWPSVSQFHLSLQKALFRESLLTFTYSGSRGRSLISRRELNSKVPTILEGGRKFFAEDSPRYNPAMGSISLQATDSSSWYDSLQVVWNRRFASDLALFASYTLAKSLDEATPTITLIETTGHAKTRMDSNDLKRDKGLSAFAAQHSLTMSLLWELPVLGGGGAWNLLFRGWRLGGLLTLASGHPFTPLISFNNSRNGVSGSTSRADRPHLKPGYNKNPRMTDNTAWYDPKAFLLPEPGFFGNLGRNTLIGPGFSTLDLSLARDFPIRSISEDSRLQFRAEFFNILNRANFDLPGNSGSVTAASYLFTDSSGTPNPAALRPIRTVSNPREIQFGLKFLW